MPISKAELLERRPITPADRERIDAHKRALALQVGLHELRERRCATQQTIASALGTSRPNISRIESEDDVLLSTLTRYVEALGGRVSIQAVFDDERVELV
jgi:DNA-binding XRE family transcriptional regulator